MTKDIKTPWIVSPFWSDFRYKEIMASINLYDEKDWNYDEIFNRYLLSGKYFDKLSIYELDRARKEFNNNELLYTYSLVSLYNQENSFLEKHYDNNACTYTIDVCLYAEKPWPLIIEGEEYIINNNEAIFFYGEDQLHWRPDFTPGNRVLMMFIHFADKNHWYFQPRKFGGE